MIIICKVKTEAKCLIKDKMKQRHGQGTVALKFDLANIPSRTYNVPSPVALRERSLANVLSPVALRERSLANILSPVALGER